jgi:hypothetical protein
LRIRNAPSGQGGRYVDDALFRHLEGDGGDEADDAEQEGADARVLGDCD